MSISCSSGITFLAAKRSEISSGIVLEGRFADAQESRFQVAKRSYMGSVVLLGGRFAEVQKLRFPNPKRYILSPSERGLIC